jgi:hypothetical protein
MRVYRTILANRLSQLGHLSLQRAQLPGVSQLALSWTQGLDMTVYFERFRLLVAHSTAVWVVLILACSGVSTPPPSLSTEPPTAATTPTSTPTQVFPEPGVERVFIQLTDPLDEPEYYCVDVPGAGRNVRLRSPLQAHTCKPIAVAADELFTMDHPSQGQIYMEAYDLCVEAEGANAGSTLGLRDCSESPLQLFALTNDLIRLSGGPQDGLCLAVATGSGIPTGGPSHLRRELTLEGCETTVPALIGWSVGLFDY